MKSLFKILTGVDAMCMGEQYLKHRDTCHKKLLS
jgi:hypothetical protein